MPERSNLMEKRDEFTDQNALAVLMAKSGLPENSCRLVLRALSRNGFVVKEIVNDEDGASVPYGTIESLNQKFERTKELEVERQGLINATRREWNDIQKKYRPIFTAIQSAIGTAGGTSDTFPPSSDTASAPLAASEMHELPPLPEVINSGTSDPLSGSDA
jgi:hypothetical protein